jgi:hypothetical protein
VGWRQSLGKLFSGLKPAPTVYLVAMMDADQAVAVAVFRGAKEASQFLIDQHRRRSGRPRGGDDFSADAIKDAYLFLNNSYHPGEFWAVRPVNVAPGGDEPTDIKYQETLFDLVELGENDSDVAGCWLPGVYIAGDEVTIGDAALSVGRVGPVSELVDQVYIAVEWLAESDVSCVVFDEVAAIKRFTVEWHNEEHPTTADFRTAFRGLNRSDEAAYSVRAVRLGRSDLTPILNGRERARSEDVGAGFCELPDTRIGQALPLDDDA